MSSWRGAGRNSTRNTPDIIGGHPGSLRKRQLLLPLPSALEMLSPQELAGSGVCCPRGPPM